MNHNTLHLCHLDEVKCIKTYCKLIKKDDAVIFYTNHLTYQQKNKIEMQFKGHAHYFICDNDNRLSTITYDNWVDLVDQYAKTFSWK